MLTYWTVQKIYQINIYSSKSGILFKDWLWCDVNSDMFLFSYLCFCMKEAIYDDTLR